MQIKTRGESRPDSLGRFTAKKLLTRSSFGYPENIPLEDRPDILAHAIGRLCNFLLERRLMTQEEFFEVLDLYNYNDLHQVVPDIEEQ